MVESVVRLAVDLPLRAQLPAQNQGQEIRSLDLCRHLKTNGREHRGHDVDVAHGLFDDATGEISEGPSQDERHMSGGVVDEVAVEALAVLTQPLAMVAGENEEGLVQNTTTLEAFAQHADERVGIGHLAVVRVVGILGAEGLGGLVGVVGLEEVDPQEEGRVPRLVEPLEGVLDGLSSIALHLTDIDRRLVGVEIKVVVVVIEAAANAPARIENEGTDEASRPPTRPGQDLGEGGNLLVEVVAHVLPHPVIGRVGTGHDRAVGRQREGHCGRSVRELHSFSNDCVDVRGRHLRRAIAGEAIAAERVDGHQNDVQAVRSSVAGQLLPGDCRLGCRLRLAARAASDDQAQTKNASAETPGDRHRVDYALGAKSIAMRISIGTPWRNGCGAVVSVRQSIPSAR